jgi:hypothetical protein
MKPLLFAAIIVVFSASLAFAAPRISVDRPTYNFGALLQGKKIEYSFVVTNSGDSPLKITHIRPACGCTAANASSPLVQPGKSSEIKVTFNSANFSGPINKTIAVESNDPATPVLTLTITGTVTEEIAVIPKQLNFGQVKPDVMKAIPLSIENKGKRVLKVLSVKTPMPQVTYKVEKNQVKPGESTVISVSVTPRPDDRILSGYITIITDDPDKGEIMVPVYGSIIR